MKNSQIISIEKNIHQKWMDQHYHATDVIQNKPKFFATFPYPYMNGMLHLGHAFTMCKVDFISRFKRIQGYNVLFPFGFHCTGMPICAAAKKLEYEIKTIDSIDKSVDKQLQYNILREFGLTCEQIVKFVNPVEWIKFFPELGLSDITNFDIMVDTSRSFITTNLNPFYNSFIEYQFTKLEKIGLLKHGTRNSVYSPTLDIQCQDHDRHSGEGIMPVLFDLCCVQIDNTNILIPIKNNPKIPSKTFDILFFKNTEMIEFCCKDGIFVCSKHLFQNIISQNIFSQNIFDIEEYKQFDNIELIKHRNIRIVNNVTFNESMKEYSFGSIGQAKLFGFCLKYDDASVLDFKCVKQISLLEDIVVDRTGNQCYVKLMPQWYIDYANHEWKEKTLYLLKKYGKSDEQITQILMSNINNLREWGVSRQFGLGTFLPIDSKELIDSLSDSTIYPAFYTIAHLIQNNIFGESKDHLNPKDFTYDIWEYIFDNNMMPDLTNSSITVQTINKMKESFTYWYPVDLRISGKDLLCNHLPMYLLNHAVIFQEKYFPKVICANGWIMVNNKKMSKSSGNFITIHELLGKQSIDSIRMTLAESGDDLNDANYVSLNATDKNLLKIYNFVKIYESYYLPSNIEKLRKDKYETIDKIFECIIQQQINVAIDHYNNHKFRDVVITMFHMYNTHREKYKIYCDHFKIEMHEKILNMFNMSQIYLINPILPHVTEHIWLNIMKQPNMLYNSSTTMSNCEYDTYVIKHFDDLLAFIGEIHSNVRTIMKKKKIVINKILIMYNCDYFLLDFVARIIESEIKYPLEIKQNNTNSFEIL